jgi:hypothetical protein
MIRLLQIVSVLTCLAAIGLVSSVVSAAPVELAAHNDHFFELSSGEYRIRFDPQRDKDGWITITRAGSESAIGTKLAHGQGLDVTAAEAGEGDLYQWTPGSRKDSRIFRSLQLRQTVDAIEITIRSRRQWADFESQLLAYKRQPGLLHWTVTATVRQDRAFSGETAADAHFVVRSSTDGKVQPAMHQVIRYAVQRGPSNPVVYFQDLAMKSLVLYFEDLTSLSGLYRTTGFEAPFDYPTAGNPGAVTMGQAAHWFQPAANPDGSRNPSKPFEPKVETYWDFGYRRPRGYRLSQGAKLVLGDTYLYLRPVAGTDNVSVCRSYVEMLAEVYRYIRKPPQIATDWRRDVVPRLVRDIMRPENTTHYRGNYDIPKAYVGYEHDDTQLWTVLNLLHPLELYAKRFPEQKEAARLRDRLSAALPLYWDKQLKWFCNNPAPCNPDTFFTTVYILIPAHMMADLAILGHPEAKAMLLDARPRYLQMGRNCDYTFADVWLRDFSRQRVLYQFDATCEYVYLMMAYYKLADGKDAEALAAAKAAATRISDRCMDLGWQVNMTAAGAVGCELLYRATGERRYRDLAYIPLANTLLQAWLWQGDYGVGRHTTTFWAFCGCPAAPCSAEFENHRTRLALRQYLEMTGKELPPAVASMLEDGWKRGLTQSRFSLPPFLTAAGAKKYMAEEGKIQTNCGEVSYDQMIPLEDVRTGWGTDLEWWQNNAKLGIIGQEIYGAGGPIWYALWQEEVNLAIERARSMPVAKPSPP